MAGCGDVRLRSNADADCIVNDWVFAYYHQTFWKEFHKSGSLSTKQLKMIEGVFADMTVENKAMHSICHLMVQLSKGHLHPDYLLLALNQLDDVMEHLGTFKPHPEDLQFVQRQIKYQVVCVCCRKGEFSLANKIFSELWGDANDCADLVVAEKLQDVIRSENADHHHILGHPYREMINHLIEFLTPIQFSFGPAFLQEAAKYIAGKLNAGGIKSKTGMRKPSTNVVLSRGALERLMSEQAEKKKDPSCSLTSQRLYRQLLLKKIRIAHNKEAYWECMPKCLQNTDVLYSALDSMCQSPQNRRQTSDAEQEQQQQQQSDTDLVDSDIEKFRYPSPVRRRCVNRRRDCRKPGLRQQVNGKSGSREQNSDDNENEDVLRHKPDSKIRPLLACPKVHHRLRRSATPAPSVVSSTGSSMRRLWTAEEEERIRQGVRMQGVGNWAKIRDAMNFHDRTSVQIKDKWRTMMRQGTNIL